MSIGVFVATALLLVGTQLYRPLRHPAALVAALAVFLTATVVLAALGSESAMLGVFFLVPTAAATLLHPAGRRTFDGSGSFSPALLGLFLVAVVPLALYVAGQLTLQLTQPVVDEHATAEHYVMMGILGLTLVVAGAVAVSGMAGWRITAWITALGAAYFGVASLAMTGQAGSAGTFWGGLLVAWAVLFVAVAEYSRRDGANRFFRRRVREAPVAA
jgi:hypothetical protein